MQTTAAALLLVLAVVLGCASTIECHICIMDPAQRGGFDISDPGDPSCFAPNAPCGAGNPWWSRPVGSPTATLLGGSTYRVHFQQNLNHYTVGHPGYLKLAWSCGVNQTSDNEFTDLAGVPDYWAHWQSTQTNFSLAVSVPNVNCPLATLQAMYHPNKPEEPIFHQCSTIAVASTSTANVRRVATGQITALFDAGSAFASIAPDTGSLGAAQAPSADFIPLAGTEAFDASTNTGYYLAASVLGGVPAYIRSIPNLLVPFSFPDARANGLFGRPFPLPTPQAVNTSFSFQWVAVAGVTQTSSSIAPAGSVLLVAMTGLGNSDYWFQLYSFSPAQPTVQPVLLATSPDLNANDIGFVNFMWAAFDPKTSVVSVLTGDENANADPLNAALVQFTLPQSGSAVTATLAVLDVSAFTFQAFQAFGGKLFALSPGLVGDSGPYGTHQWYVVQFSGVSGAILSSVPLSAATAPGSTASTYLPDLLGRYQGGIHNGVTAEGLLVSLFYRTEDAQPLLAFVNPSNGAVAWSTYLNSAPAAGQPASLLFKP